MSLIVYHSDVHGGMSGLVALKALLSKEFEVVHHFSNFDRNPPATEPEAFPDTLKILTEQYRPQKIYVLDIPIDIRNPARAVQTIEEVLKSAEIQYVDHHEVPNEALSLVTAGVLRPYKSAYEMSLHVPKMLSALNSELEYFVVIGAVADGDYSVAGVVSKELEYEVNTYVDSAWKHGFREIEEVKNLTPKYGNAGAIVQFLLQHNIDCNEFLDLAQRYGEELEPVDHEVRGHVVVAKEIPKEGFGWKMAWLLCWLTGAPIAVVKHISRGKMTVITATYWRKPNLKPLVDKAVFGVVTDRTRVVGHPGARSILVNSNDEADEIIRRVVEEINTRFNTESSGVISVSN